MIIPAKNQWRGWVALALIQALLVWLDAPLALNWGLLAAWLMLLMTSALLLWREKPDFRISRDYGAVQQSGQPFTMQLALHNAVPRDLALHLFDHYPPQAESSAMPQRVRLGAGERLELAYPLTLQQRGRFQFTALQLRYPDRLALWQRDLSLPAPAEVRVYPRFAHDHADSAFAGIRTPQLGHVHPLYKRGGNGDFSHLRNYLDGDSINRIDHKASARLGKWLVREYDYEHEQPVILMLDASRRLQTRYKGRALFDEQLAAATRLARAALKSGDEIGLQTFSDTPKIWLPASRHAGQYRRLVEALFDHHADDKPPDYAAAIHDVWCRERRRALIILMTILEPHDSEHLRPLLHLLQKRHHVMLINIRPPWLEEDNDGENRDAALENAARDVYANTFATNEARLKQEKLIYVTARPETLRPQLINAYLAYKKHLRH